VVAQRAFETHAVAFIPVAEWWQEVPPYPGSIPADDEISVAEPFDGNVMWLEAMGFTSSDSVDAVTRWYLTEMQRRQTPRGNRARYGLGWAHHDVSEDGSPNVVSHGGALGAKLWIDRRRQLVGAFLIHQAAGQVKDMRERLWERVTELFSGPNGR